MYSRSIKKGKIESLIEARVHLIFLSRSEFALMGLFTERAKSAQSKDIIKAALEESGLSDMSWDSIGIEGDNLTLTTTILAPDVVRGYTFSEDTRSFEGATEKVLTLRFFTMDGTPFTSEGRGTLCHILHELARAISEMSGAVLATVEVDGGELRVYSAHHATEPDVMALIDMTPEEVYAVNRAHAQTDPIRSLLSLITNEVTAEELARQIYYGRQEDQET